MGRKLLILSAVFCAIQNVFALTIEDGKFYTIANRNDVNLYVKDTGVDVIQMGALDDACYWQFIATANEGCYYIKNKKTGRYAQLCSTTTEVNVTMGDSPVEYRAKQCTEEGTDMFGLTSTNQSNYEFTSGCVGWNWKGDNTVQTFAAAAGTNHRSFWKLTLVTPPMSININKVYTEENIINFLKEYESINLEDNIIIAKIKKIYANLIMYINIRKLELILSNQNSDKNCDFYLSNINMEISHMNDIYNYKLFIFDICMNNNISIFKKKQTNTDAMVKIGKYLNNLAINFSFFNIELQKD